MSQHISQSYFIKEKENGRPVLMYNLMQTLERVWSNLKVLICKPTGSGSHKLSNSAKLSLVFASLAIYCTCTVNTGGHFYYFLCLFLNKFFFVLHTMWLASYCVSTRVCKQRILHSGFYLQRIWIFYSIFIWILSSSGENNILQISIVNE